MVPLSLMSLLNGYLYFTSSTETEDKKKEQKTKEKGKGKQQDITLIESIKDEINQELSPRYIKFLRILLSNIKNIKHPKLLAILNIMKEGLEKIPSNNTKLTDPKKNTIINEIIEHLKKENDIENGLQILYGIGGILEILKNEKILSKICEMEINDEQKQILQNNPENNFVEIVREKKNNFNLDSTLLDALNKPTDINGKGILCNEISYILYDMNICNDNKEFTIPESNFPDTVTILGDKILEVQYDDSKKTNQTT